MIFVKISLNEKNVHLSITTETQDAMKSIESQMPALKEKLMQSGLTAEKIELKYKEAENYAANRENNSQSQSNDRDGKENRRQYLKSLAFLNQNRDSNDNGQLASNVINRGNYIEEFK